MIIKVIKESRYWLKIALMIFNEDINPSLPFFVTEYSQNLYDTVSPSVFFKFKKYSRRICDTKKRKASLHY